MAPRALAPAGVELLNRARAGSQEGGSVSPRLALCSTSMPTTTRRSSRSQSRLFSVTAVDAALKGWSTTRGYQLPVVELIGPGMPGEVVLTLRDDASIEASIQFALSGCGLHVSDSSIPRREATAIDAELVAWWFA